MQFDTASSRQLKDAILRLDQAHWFTRVFKRPVIGAIAGVTLFAGILATQVQADPADDALAKLNELSRQAEQTTESMHSAQLDLNNKLAVQQAAEAKHAADASALESSRSQLATFQTSVNKIAAAQYMGGRPDGLDALLTATSPQGLIDQMSIQRVMATEMSSQMKSFREVGTQAAVAEEASAKSAAEAKTAAEQAAAVRADLQSKQSQLQTQIAIVKAQYEALSPNQRQALAAMPPAPPIPPPALHRCHRMTPRSSPHLRRPTCLFLPATFLPVTWHLLAGRRRQPPSFRPRSAGSDRPTPGAGPARTRSTAPGW